MTTFPVASEKDLEALMRAARSFDRDAFDKGPSGIEDMMAAIEVGEIEVGLTPEGQPYTSRDSFWMYIRHGDLFLKERYRVRGGQKIMRKTRGRAGSETRIGGDMEGHVRSIIRAYWDEFGIEVRESDLDFKMMEHLHQRYKERSSVHVGWESWITAYPVLIAMEKMGYLERRWKDGRMVWDVKTIIRCEWDEATEDMLPGSTDSTLSSFILAHYGTFEEVPENFAGTL